MYYGECENRKIVFSVHCSSGVCNNLFIIYSTNSLHRFVSIETSVLHSMTYLWVRH